MGTYECTNYGASGLPDVKGLVKKAVMCITGSVLGNHTKSLVGNKNHSFEYNGKTICVEKGKEAYSITLTDVNIKSLMSSLWKPMPNIEAASNVLVTCKYGKTRT